MYKLVLKFTNNPGVYTSDHPLRMEAFKQLYSLTTLYRMLAISIYDDKIVCLAKKEERDDIQQ